MIKIAPYILGIIAIIFISVGVSKSFAFDIVSSPTTIQNWTYWKTQYWSGYFSIENITFIRDTLKIKTSTGLVLNSVSWPVVNSMGSDYGIPHPYDATYQNSSWYKIYNDRYIIIEINSWGPNSNFRKKSIFFFDTLNNSIIVLYSCLSDGATTCSSSIIWSKIVQFEFPSVFVSSSYIHISNWTNTYFYSFSGTLIQTISDPSVSFWKKPVAFPVYLDWLSWTHFFAYQGTDNKSYKVIDTFASGQDLPITSAGTGSVLPLGKFYTNDLLLARQTAGSGSLYIGNWATATPSWETSTGYVLTSFNTFQNPIAYFTASGGTIVKWDMNCDYPWYDSCTLNGGVFKCTNSAGTLSPWWEVCWGTVIAGTCSDGIKNGDETAIDYGGSCGTNQTCWNETLYTLTEKVYYTGAYDTQTIEMYWTGAMIGSGDYLEDITPPTSWTGYALEQTQYKLHGAYITSASGTFRGLWSNNFTLTVPGWLQSPSQYTSFVWSSFLEVASLEQPDYITIVGTGGTGNQWTIKMPWTYGYGSQTPSYEAWKGCVYLHRDDDSKIFDVNYKYFGYPEFTSCYKVTTMQSMVTNPLSKALNKSQDWFYHARVMFPSTALDINYFFAWLDIWHYQRTPYTEYVCHNTISGEITNGSGAVIDPVTYSQAIISSTGSTKEDTTINTYNQLLSWSLNFTLWVLPSVSSGADCTQIFDTSNGTFLYGDSHSSLNLGLDNDFSITTEAWSCVMLGSDICKTAYIGINGIITSLFSLFLGWVNSLSDTITDSVSYIGYPDSGKNYCFAGKNMYFAGRPSTYLDTKYVSHTLSVNVLTLFDLMAMGMMSLASVYMLIRYWKW